MKDNELNALRNELLSSLPTKLKSKSNGNGLNHDKSPSYDSEPHENRDHNEEDDEERDDKIVVYEELKEFDAEDENEQVNEEDEELERLRLEAIKAKRAKQQNQLNQPGQIINRIYLNPNHISQTNNVPRNFYNGKYQRYRSECDKLMPNDVYEPEPSLKYPNAFLPLSNSYSYSNNSTVVDLDSNLNLNRNDLRHLLKARNYQRNQSQSVSRPFQTEIELLTDADLEESENELIYSKPITEPIHVRKPNDHWNTSSAFRFDKVNLKIEVNNDLHLESSQRSESLQQRRDNTHRSHRNLNHEQVKSATDKVEHGTDIEQEQKNEVDEYFDESDEEVGEYKCKRLKSIVVIPVSKALDSTRNEQKSRRDSTSKHHSDDSRKRVANH
jgi:hypothetical protein